MQRLNAVYSAAIWKARVQPSIVSPPVTVGFVEMKHLYFCYEYFSFRYMANRKPAQRSRFESLINRSVKFYRLLWPVFFSEKISKLLSSDSSSPVSF